MNQKRMVFHVPFPLQKDGSAASQIRPVRMLEAFKSLGYDVFVIQGYARERRESFAELKRKVAAGWAPSFAYSEAATIPSSFTEPKHIPLVLDLERRIFRYLKARGIPAGVFYRDVHWAFKDYDRRVGNPAIAYGMRRLYHYEIETFNKYVEVLFLPSKKMAQYISGIRVKRIVELPPGGDRPAPEASPESKSSPNSEESTLDLLYVGVVGTVHYDVEQMALAVEQVPRINLTICTNTENWVPPRERIHSGEMSSEVGGSVKVVHAYGDGLNPLYEAANIACVVVEPHEYWTFAAPMKLYGYLSHGKPVLASEGTHTAEIVQQTGAGWVVPYEREAIAEKLAWLRDHPEEVEEKSRVAARVSRQNTWADRARSVEIALVREPASNREMRDTESSTQKPRIAFIPSWYPNSPEDLNGSFFREQAEALVRAGFQVDVFVPEMLPVYSGADRPRNELSVTTEGELGVVRASLNQYVPKNPYLSTKLARHQLWKAWEKYEEAFGRPDVLQAHSLYPGAFIAKEISARYGIPFVYTEHRSLGHLSNRSQWSRDREREVVDAAAARIAVSAGHAAHLADRFGSPKEHWGFIPNLLPSGMSDGVVLRKADSESFVFGHLSVLDPVKQVDLLLRAFADLAQDDPSTTLVIGGDGPEGPRLQALAKELGLEDRVKFLGRLGRDEIPAFFSEIDAFVLPSSSEAFGVVLLESLASGVPVISTKTWGGETVVRSGDGLLVEIGDQEGLTRAMRELRDTEDTPEAKQSRWQRCLDRFGEESFVRRYQEIYNRALDNE